MHQILMVVYDFTDILVFLRHLRLVKLENIAVCL